MPIYDDNPASGNPPIPPENENQIGDLEILSSGIRTFIFSAADLETTVSRLVNVLRERRRQQQEKEASRIVGPGPSGVLPS